MPNTAQTVSSDPLARLLQKNQFVGWLGAADFARALVLTSDVWKAQARGVPHNCFLLAAAVEAPEEILLLRVTGSAETPADAELQSKLEKLKSRAPASGGTSWNSYVFTPLPGALKVTVCGEQSPSAQNDATQFGRRPAARKVTFASAGAATMRRYFKVEATLPGRSGPR